MYVQTVQLGASFQHSPFFASFSEKKRISQHLPEYPKVDILVVLFFSEKEAKSVGFLRRKRIYSQVVHFRHWYNLHKI